MFATDGYFESPGYLRFCMDGDGYMPSLLTIIIGFILTTVIGGYLIQKWQQNNWHIQQKFLGREKEYIALKELTDELSSLLGARIFHMKRMVLSTRMPNDEFFARVPEYSEITKRWNERLTSFFTRLTILASHSFTQRLEGDLQSRLVNIGMLVDRIITDRKSDHPISSSRVDFALTSLNSLQGMASRFSRDLLKLVEARREEVYYGVYIEYRPRNLHRFSTWDLVKSLFVRDIDSYAILRPAVDSDFPSGRRR